MILPIYTFGQSVLRKQADDVTPDYPNLKELIENMFETMTRADGIGLAGPQVGLPIRLVVIDLDVLKNDYPELEGYRHAFINPRILETHDETCVMDEGCLSLPGLHESVRRPAKIRVAYMDENFQPHDRWVDGFEARVMQHELDHLEGKMFVDRLSALRKQMVKGKLNDMLKGKVSCSYKVKAIR